jgi:hypothetical protein
MIQGRLDFTTPVSGIALAGRASLLVERLYAQADQPSSAAGFPVLKSIPASTGTAITASASR